MSPGRLSGQKVPAGRALEQSQISENPESLPGTWPATGQGPCLARLSGQPASFLKTQNGCPVAPWHLAGHRDPVLSGQPVQWLGQLSGQPQTAVWSVSQPGGTARAYGLAVPCSNGHWPAAIAILALGFRWLGSLSKPGSASQARGQDSCPGSQPLDRPWLGQLSHCRSQPQDSQFDPQTVTRSEIWSLSVGQTLG